jgi:hypothetical protein
MVAPKTPTAGEPGDAVAYEAARAQLPTAYALALRLATDGTPQAEICKRLDIEPEGLEVLLELAIRKLQRKLTEK